MRVRLQGARLRRVSPHLMCSTAVNNDSRPSAPSLNCTWNPEAHIEQLRVGWGNGPGMPCNSAPQLVQQLSA